MSTERVIATWSDDRVVVRLARPERLNAIDAAMVEQLHRVPDRLEKDSRHVRILTGGKDGVLAAGADLAEPRERTHEDALAASI